MRRRLVTLMFTAIAATLSMAGTAAAATPTAHLSTYQIGPLTVVADASGSTDSTTITGYSFDFGDGTVTTSTSPVVHHAYAQVQTLPVTITVTVTDSAGNTATAARKIRVGSAYFPLPPTRIADTRTGIGPLGGPVYPRQALLVQMAGKYGIPASGVTAVVLNLTAIDPSAPDYLAVVGSAINNPAPGVSTLNVVPGQIVANLVTVPLDRNGGLTVYNNSATVNVVADLEGYYAVAPAASTGGMLTMTTPQRLLDTRTGLGTAGPGPVAGGGQALAGVDSLDQHQYPITAPVLNVTATDVQASGFVRVTGSNLNADTSNINFDRGDTIANEAFPLLNPAYPGFAQIAVHSYGSADIVADASGYFSGPNSQGGFDPNGMGFTPEDPSRLVDTRGGASPGLGPNSTLHQPVSGVVFLPADAKGVVLNVTVTNTTQAGYLTVFPHGSPRPATSNVNFAAGQTLAAQVYVRLGPGGDIDIYNHAGTADVVVDLEGYFS